MKEIIGKLNNFGFLQWFGLVCYAIGGAMVGFISGFLLSNGWAIFGPQSLSDWQQMTTQLLAGVPIPIGAYSGAKEFITRQK